MNTVGDALVSGVVLGISAGWSPGPLLTLVITETLRTGISAGIRVAAAPLITDTPIILVALVLMPRLNASLEVMGVISLAGAVFIAWMAFESMVFKGSPDEARAGPQASIWRGVLANALNPSPYLFWFTVGGAMVLRTADQNRAAAAVFILVFYFFLVGSKMVLALAVGRYGRFLQSRVYVWTLRLLGVVLLVFAGRFLWQAARFLGWSAH
ncbi:MAG: LysE family transporter [Desulfobacterales bacterium]|nr:LysE family transporter [Desulfobacterales bacterium]MDJ0989649.1 LysE family transporter [Desulfobacterales bacterium]